MKKAELSVGQEVKVLVHSRSYSRKVRPAVVLSTETGWHNRNEFQGDRRIEREERQDNSGWVSKGTKIAVAYHDWDDCWYPHATVTNNIAPLDDGFLAAFNNRIQEARTRRAVDREREFLVDALAELFGTKEFGTFFEFRKGVLHDVEVSIDLTNLMTAIGECWEGSAADYVETFVRQLKKANAADTAPGSS